MGERKPIHDCPCCTCGMIELTWSDRSCFVVEDDPQQIAEAIYYCAADHCYDRHDGVPYGLPNTIRDAVRPVVARHLSAIRPDWLDHSVSPTEDQKVALIADLVAVIKPLLTDGG